MRTLLKSLIVFVLVMAHLFVQDATAQDPLNVSQLAVPGGPIQVSVTPKILSLRGDIQLVIQLTDPPLAVAQGKNAKKVGGKMGPVQQRAYLAQISQKQDALLAQIRNRGGRDSSKLGKALNAVVVTIAAARVAEIAALPGVRSVRQLHDYQMDLAETVPYIGAAAVQNAGFNGAGVSVAALDSGIDYTHKFFGGPGTAAAYSAAYGTTTADPKNKTTDGLFPTGKVVGGYDFVGEAWPSGPLAPDPDPIDCGPSTIA